MAALILAIYEGYLWAGLAVAAVFLTVGLGRVAPDARGSFMFRPLLIPGIALLWPAVIARWVALERGGSLGEGAFKPPRRAQTVLALSLAILVVVTLMVTLTVRQDGPLERQPILLDAPAAGGSQ